MTAPADGYAARMRRLLSPFGPALAALRLTATDPDLGRLLLSWFAVNAGKWAFLVTNLVLAYEAGGTVAVGLLGLFRFLTPTILAPFAGLPTVRWRPEAVLRATNTVRATAIVLAIATIAAELPIEVLYLVVGLEAGVGAFSRPLHMALLPAVARTPSQLVGANVASSAAEGLGTFAGPALASLLMVAVGPIASSVAVFAIYLIGVGALLNVHVPIVGRSPASARGALRQMSTGVRALARFPGPRWVVLDLGFQTFVRGLLTVLVVFASIELLGLGDPGVGTLNAAMGLGGIVGAVVAITLAGRARLSPPFVLALAAWGAPIAVIGLIPVPWVAVLAMLAVGVSNALLDVSGFTLVQRLTPNESRVGVLGLIDGVANGGVALGGVMAPLLIELVGIRGALIATGSILPIAAILTWPLLRRIDEGGPASARRTEILRADPLFAPLSLATVEYLGSCLVPVTFEDGAWLMREGEPGHEYLLIDSGTVEVSQGDRVLRTMGRGEGIGEIALLHDVPRTASVRAVGPVSAYSLDRQAFLEAVSGHAASQAHASARVQDRLSTDAQAVDLH